LTLTGALDLVSAASTTREPSQEATHRYALSGPRTPPPSRAHATVAAWCSSSGCNPPEPHRAPWQTTRCPMGAASSVP